MPRLRMTAVGRAWHAVALTNAHDDKEARQEPPKVDDTVSCALHEIIAIRRSPAEPVR